MSPETVIQLLDEHFVNRGSSDKHRWGILWERVEEHENKWNLLPGYKSLPQSNGGSRIGVV
jgi:hypothetical protein